MKSQGLGATKIAKTLGIGRASVYRILQAGHPVLAINHCRRQKKGSPATEGAGELLSHRCRSRSDARPAALRRGALVTVATMLTFPILAAVATMLTFPILAAVATTLTFPILANVATTLRHRAGG
jgi:hypothetical protein